MSNLHAVIERMGAGWIGDPAAMDDALAEDVVIEYELGGVITSTGRRARARFIGVLRVRGGRIAAWREYQDTYAIQAALTP
jgi:hypothetical protein